MAADSATSVQQLAKQAYDCFEPKTRDSGEVFYTLKDGSPEWVSELVHTAHGDDFLPDDYRYKWAMEACEWIASADDPDDGSGEFADQAVDVYTSERLKWLSSNLNRLSYCDEAAGEYGDQEPSAGIIDRIGWGQYMEAEEVYVLVLKALEDVSAEVD